MKILIQVLCLYIGSLICVENKEELKLVFTIFRHGDRAPIEIYPKDDYQSSVWPLGLGNLTPLGKRNAFDLGRYFWHRYGSKLNLKTAFAHNSTEFHIRSTAIHRAKTSAVYFLAGFYQQDFKEVVATEVATSEKYAVPFSPQQEDELLSMTDCVKRDKLLGEWKASSDEYKQFLNKNEALYRVLLMYSGWKADDKISHIVDAIYCEVAHSLTQPDWVQNNLSPMMEYFDERTKFAGPTTKLKQINSGPLVSKLIHEIDNKIHGESEDKMLIYSAHDTNVVDLLTALGCHNDKQPTYSSAVIIELYKVEQIYYIHVYFHNASRAEPYSLSVPGCNNKARCSYREFKKAVQPVMLSILDRGTICNAAIYKSGSLKLSDNIIPVTVVTVIIVGAVLGFIMFKMYRRRRQAPRGDPMMYRPLAYGDDDDE